MWSFIIGLFGFVLLLLSPFIIMCFFWLVFYWFKGYRFKKGEYKYIGYGNFFKRIFIDFPRQFILDRYNADPDFFRESGVHIIAGEQGAGKSITLTYMLNRFQKMYPKMIIKTNYGYTRQDGEINHWRDIVASENGIYGEIDVIDEIQNWFNSLQSKDFPPEMMTEITQQRKQRKCIFGTSQVFGRVAKPIREQVTFLYEPMTLFGCLTIVRKYKPYVKADGNVDEKKLRGCFFFVHSPEIRDSFDTYKKIEQMGKEGFKPSSEQMLNNNTVINLNQSDKGLFKK